MSQIPAGHTLNGLHPVNACVDIGDRANFLFEPLASIMWRLTRLKMSFGFAAKQARLRRRRRNRAYLQGLRLIGARVKVFLMNIRSPDVCR